MSLLSVLRQFSSFIQQNLDTEGRNISTDKWAPIRYDFKVIPGTMKNVVFGKQFSRRKIDTYLKISDVETTKLIGQLTQLPTTKEAAWRGKCNLLGRSIL